MLKREDIFLKSLIMNSKKSLLIICQICLYTRRSNGQNFPFLIMSKQFMFVKRERTWKNRLFSRDLNHLVEHILHIYDDKNLSRTELYHQ